MSPFESPRLLLDRAKTHIDEFEAVERAFSEEKPYAQFRETDPQSGDILLKIRITKDLPPALSVILFEIVNCMRSSLDHAVFDSTVALTGEASPKYTKFPFGETEAQARGDLKRKQSKVPECIWPYLLSFRPFDPSSGGDESLYGLNDIRNGKIHKTLTEMAMTKGSMGLGNALINGTFTIVNNFSSWDSEKKELTYMRARMVGDVSVEIYVSVFVAFANGTPFAGRKALPFLRELLEIFNSVVLGIEAETTRLKGI